MVPAGVTTMVSWYGVSRVESSDGVMVFGTIGIFMVPKTALKIIPFFYQKIASEITKWKNLIPISKLVWQKESNLTPK